MTEADNAGRGKTCRVRFIYKCDLPEKTGRSFPFFCAEFPPRFSILSEGKTASGICQMPVKKASETKLTLRRTNGEAKPAGKLICFPAGFVRHSEGHDAEVFI